MAGKAEVEAALRKMAKAYPAFALAVSEYAIAVEKAGGRVNTRSAFGIPRGWERTLLSHLQAIDAEWHIDGVDIPRKRSLPMVRVR